MKKVIILVLFFNMFWVNAQDKVVTKNGKEIEVNKDATTTTKGVVKLAGDLGGTADVPTVPGLANKQDMLTLTTTGAGNATLTGATLNIPPQSASSPFNLISTNTDAGSNKNSVIWRTGGIMLGDGLTSSDSFSGYFLAKGDMIAYPNIFEFRNTGTVNTGIFASNGGGANFLPNFRMSSSGTFRSILIGEILTDSGTDPALQFRSQLQNLGPLTTRPTFTWQNGGVGGTEQMRLTASGYLGINTTPLGRFVSNDNAYIASIPATTANLMDNTTFKPNARFQTTAGVNNNALSFYSTTSNWGVQAHNYSIGTALPMLLQPVGGNVGIGKSTIPGFKLEVIGDARFNYNTTNTGTGGDNTWAGFYGKIADANSQVGGLKLGWYSSFGGIEVIRPGGATGLGLAFNYAETTVGTTLEGFRLTNDGKFSVGNTAPTQKITFKGVNAQPATTGSTSNATVRIEGDSNHALDIGTFTSSPYGSYIQSVDKGNLSTSLPLNLNPVAGNVGIGVNNPVSKLEINGAATNTTAFNAAAGTTIDFSKSNLAYTTASAGAFTLTNMKDGGTYTLAVQGATSGTASFTATGFTFKSPNNGATTASKHTLYTFIVMGTTVYYYMTTGL